MQDRYVADKGDFGKYGLLRAVCGPAPPLRLGVAWYRVPNESNTNDGKFTGYLEPSPRNLADYRACDPPLYDALQGIIRAGDRRVAAIRERSILPDTAAYHETPLTFEGLPTSDRAGRMGHRRQWTDGALSATADSDLVFLDPDNGLEAGTRAFQNKGPKYVYYEEIAPYVARGQSLIVYHHTSRQGTAREQVERRLAEIEERLTPQVAPHALLYHRGSSRAYFVIPAAAHGRLIRKRVESFLRGPWSRHFELID
jgi:hypothetical protein